MTEEDQNGDKKELSQNSQEELAEDFPSPQKMVKRVERFFGMKFTSQSGALLEKMGPEQIDIALANADKSNSRHHCTTRTVLISGIIGLFALCWLFLAYEASDHIDAMITGLLGLAGGYGYGKSKKD